MTKIIFIIYIYDYPNKKVDSRSQIFFKIGVRKNFAKFDKKTCVGDSL